MANNSIEAIEQKLPVGRNIIFALQHVFIMVAGAVVVPITIAGVAGVDSTFLISCALFAAGVATLIQTLSIKGIIGAKLPVIEATSFASLSTLTGIVTLSANSGGGNVGLREIAGAVISAGLFCLLLSGVWGKLLRFFPPVVIGTVVTVIGISLFPIGVRWISAVPEGAPIINMLSAVITFIIVILCNKFLKGILGNLSILFGVVGGTFFAFILDFLFASQIASGAVAPLIDLAPVKEAAWFGLVKPFAFGAPVFKVSSIISLILIMLVIMTEATGNMIAIHTAVGSRISEKDLAKGLRSSGISTMVSGIFNSYPVTPFAQNIGMLNLTGVYSRFVNATAGIILLVLAFFPKVAAIFAAIPKPVLGGASFVMFGVVALGGIKTLGKVDYNGNKNSIVASVSIGLSLIPTVAPNFFGQLPPNAANVMHSGITIGCVSAIVLNIFFNMILLPKDKK